MSKTVLIVLSMSFGLAACGPDGGSSTSDDMLTAAAQFIGAWSYESLESSYTCSDGEQGTDTTVSGTETFTQGARPDQVIAVDKEGCRSECQVSGKVATCQTDLSACLGGGITVTVTSDVYTSFGDRLSEHASFRIAREDGTTCDLTGTAWLVPAK